MKKNWKLAGAALLIAIAVPVTAYAADNLNNKSPEDKKKDSYAVDQKTKPAGKQGERPNPDKNKGINLDLQTIGSSKLGLDQAAFEQAQKEGKSLADIAKEKGKELQPLIDALTNEISDMIQANLGPKELTAEQKENVKKKAAMEAERIFTIPLNKESDKQQGNDWNLAAALELIGIDKATFAEQVHSDKSFTDIAKEHGVTRQQLIDALLSDINTKLDEVKASGNITQGQADQKKQAVLKEVEDFVDHTQTLFMKKESFVIAQGKDVKGNLDKGIKLDFQQIAASKLGLDKAAFQQAVKDGKSLADIAKEKGIELQPLIDGLTKEISDEIQVKLSAKDLTAEEKENVKKKAAMESERVFTTPLNKEQEMEKGVGPFNVQAAFALLGIDKATFAEQVQAGKSFADIAIDRGVARQKLIETLMSDFTTKIDDVKTKGDITQEQADQKKQAVLKEVEDFVDHTQSMFNKQEKK